MIYLLLSIFFSTGLFVIFKYFGIYKIDTLKAIVVNYVVAFLLGFLSAEKTIAISEIHHQSWFFGALFLGVLFVSIFFVMAITAQKNGISVASISGKMSVVIPIFFGFFLYDESINFFKITGIIIALVAVYLASDKNDKNNFNKEALVFPLLLFFGSGIIDTTLKYVEVHFVLAHEVAIFSGSLFAIAAFFGSIILGIKALRKKVSFGFKNIIAGIVLGVPNYYSIVFLIKALQTEGFESSTLFTLNNVAIVIVSSILGLILFKERFYTKNKIGVFLAVIGIILVTLA